MRRTGPDRATRDLIYERDKGACRRCGSVVELQIHHRRPRAMGGTRRDDANSPANLLLLCEDCHRTIESNRSLALSFGWLVRQAEDPADVLVLLAEGWAWLDGDGSVRWARAS